nr:hypothetical protein [Tanacetum cinerariifolium]
MRLEECDTWDGGKITWGGRVGALGTVPVCVCVCTRRAGEGVAILAGKGVKLENIRTHQSSGSLDFEVLIVGYEHVVMNYGSAGIRISSMTKALLIPKYQDHQTQHALIIETSQSRQHDKSEPVSYYPTD